MPADPPLITLIKSKNDEKLEKDCVKITLRRDPTSANLELYELKMALFDIGEPEEFLLFIRNLQMDLEASRTPYAGVKIQYIRTLVNVEALRQLDMLSAEVGIITSEHLKSIILALGT